MEKIIITTKQCQEVMYVYEVEGTDKAQDIVNKINETLNNPNKDARTNEELASRMFDGIGTLKFTRITNINQSLSGITAINDDMKDVKLCRLIDFSPKYYEYLTKAADEIEDIHPGASYGIYMKLQNLNPHILYGIVEDFLTKVELGETEFDSSYIDKINKTISSIYFLLVDTEI